jgi:hypothetical protein
MEQGIQYYLDSARNPYLGNQVTALHERAMYTEFLDDSLGLFDVASIF